jgi:phage-related baseplate assembly protein
VSGPQIHTYQIHAVLTLYSGPDGEVVRQAAEAALIAYMSAHHKLGHDITIAGLHAALFREGVQNVDLGGFNADLVVGAQGAAYCTEFSVVIGGRNV